MLDQPANKIVVAKNIFKIDLKTPEVK